MPKALPPRFTEIFFRNLGGIILVFLNSSCSRRILRITIQILGKIDMGKILRTSPDQVTIDNFRSLPKPCQQSMLANIVNSAGNTSGKLVDFSDGVGGENLFSGTGNLEAVLNKVTSLR